MLPPPSIKPPFVRAVIGSLLLLSLPLGCAPKQPTDQPQAIDVHRTPRARVAQFQVGRDMPLVHFGELTPESATRIRENFHLVVIEPTKAKPALIRHIQAGPDGQADTPDDVVVLGYFSAGEDARTNFSNRRPLARGDRSGPRVDPRPGAPFPDGNRDLRVDTLLGRPSPGGTGYASYYMDDNDRNGEPDRNRLFGGAFVNAGDPAWFQDSLEFSLSRDGIAGLREILGRTYGRGLGCDGVMLDTFDTPSPNGWTNEQSPNQCEFEWTASGFKAFTKRLRTSFPDKVIMVNRGASFFNPDLGHYRYHPGSLIDLFLFESFYSDSDPNHPTTPYWHDNRGVYAPRLSAEADRHGFKIVALGYKPTTMAAEIAEESSLGWFPVLSDPGLLQIHPLKPAYRFPEPKAPTWDTTFFQQASASPRVGLQQVVAEQGQITLRWDIAHAMRRPVRYNLYYQAGPTLDIRTANVIRRLPMEVSKSYGQGTGPESYPFEYRLKGLSAGTYSFLIRAEDAGTPALEETNQNVHTIAVP